ncbi:hypothetical protein Q4R87_03215, partial [Morganella morganii]
FFRFDNETGISVTLFYQYDKSAGVFIILAPLPAVPPSHRSDTGDFSPLLKITFIRICHT